MIKIGVVGCGAVTENLYVPALKELELLGVGAVVRLFDPDDARFQVIQSAFPDAKRSENLDAMVGEIGLAIIASPVRFHTQQTVKLLEAGIAVLCEKPMAATVAEAEAMAAAAKQAQVPLAIGLFRRFFPAAQAIHAAVVQESLGKVTGFQFSEGGKFNWPTQTPAFFSPKAPGGVLFDLGVHLLDLMLWWFGEPQELTYQDDYMGGVEINSHLQLDYGHFQGDVRMSWDSPLPNRYFIAFEKGWMRWNVGAANGLEMGFNGSPFAINGEVHDVQPEGTIPALGAVASTYQQSFIAQLLNICAAIRGEETLLVPASEGARSVRLLARCYQQRELIPMPWLTEAERAGAGAKFKEATGVQLVGSAAAEEA